MSVWLQSLGEFFWVFVMNEVGELELYKVMGETVTFENFEASYLEEVLHRKFLNMKQVNCDEQAQFVCYDVKPVPIKMNKFGTWTMRSGMFAKACSMF